MENQTKIMNELADIKECVASLKEYLEDIALTREDVEAIQNSEKELEEGKTTSLENLKKEMGIQ